MSLDDSPAGVAGGPISAIALHMDSLGWAAGGGCAGVRDPTWFEVLDRFLDMARQRKIPLTLFVIGRDLRDPEVRRRVLDAHEAGHEIASHSFSHSLDLAARAPSEIAWEVERSKAAIEGAVGRPPRGFASPAWSRSLALDEALVDAGYTYDASGFPSWLMVPMLAKLLWNFRGHPSRRQLLARSDVSSWFTGARAPAEDCSGLVTIPVPTTRRFRLACWHTLSFVLPERGFWRILEECMQERWFMYIVHPADLMAPGDVPSAYRCSAKTFERLRAPLHVKLERMEAVLDGIVARSSAMVSCEELAARHQGHSRLP